MKLRDQASEMSKRVVQDRKNSRGKGYKMAHMHEEQLGGGVGFLGLKKEEWLIVQEDKKTRQLS